jgi:hypothetical protein
VSLAAHHRLQRAAVRMLYDPEFASAARAQPEAVLGAAGLGPDERRLLLAVDPRAFRTDPLRRRRTLRALAAELKVSTTLALHATRSLSFVEGFFASPEFHQSVASRTALFSALGAYLTREAVEGRLEMAALPDIVRLELQVAQARRRLRLSKGRVDTDAAERSVRENRAVAAAPGVDALSVAAGTLEVMNAVERYLFEVGLMPAVALADDAPRLVLPPPAAVDAEPLHLLIIPTGPSGSSGPSGSTPSGHTGSSSAAVSLVPVEEDIVAVVQSLPGTPERVCAVLAGVEEERVRTILVGLAGDGLLALPTEEG